MINNEWNELLERESQKPYMKELKKILVSEYNTQTIYPPKSQIFSALELTPPSHVKVVILGQDPYHGPGQAHGLAFSVNPTVQTPPSLKNIYKELEAEYNTVIDRSGDLRDWAKQGVLLLNPILTVREHQPLSHQKIGWQLFTNEILRTLNDLKQPIVFILWGAKAREAKKFLTNPNHLILESAHPSPLSVSRGFFGSNCFKKANDYLIAHHETPIEWTCSNK
ncbi:uracil-DNA glycosylase [Firmicutes bacterium M10-2]|nr:uracil-DNA glycosylase [Firmicutes bacterium M10-2]